jgi:uncharacterized protein (TIGR02757 family)
MLLPTSFSELADLLNDRLKRYACPEFIQDDPIHIPHQFKSNQDIEISALFSAVFAWGSRKSIVNSARRLMNIMGQKPYEFVVNFSKSDEKRLQGFVHRTFSSTMRLNSFMHLGIFTLCWADCKMFLQLVTKTAFGNGSHSGFS